MLTSTRQRYHQQLAQALEARLETVETQPELLAHHYTEAGLAEPAVGYWQRAGQRSRAQSAYVEAVAHLTKGLEVLKTMPERPARTQQELDIQIALGLALIATRGYATPEVETAYTRARTLCQQLGDTSQLCLVLGGLWQFYMVRAEYQTVHEIGAQILSMAQDGQDTPLLVMAHDILGQAFFFQGAFVESQTHFEQVMTLYHPQHHHALAVLCGEEDPGVACRSHLAWSLWLRGYPEQALRRSYEALTPARELARPFSVVFALHMTALLHQHYRQVEVVQARLEEVMVLSQEQGFALWLAWVTIMQGWMLTEQGQSEQGIAQMHQGLTAWRATGARIAWASQRHKGNKNLLALRAKCLLSQPLNGGVLRHLR